MKIDRSRIAWTGALLTFLVGASITLLGASSGGSEAADKAPANVQDKAQDPSPAAVVAAPSDAASNTSGTSAATTPAASAAPAPESIASTASPYACLSDPRVLDEINRKREELDQRQKNLSAKESELNSREQAITAEFQKLKEMRDEIAKIGDGQSQANQEKVAKVVETLEGMSPKASAKMLADLDEGLAVAAIARMDTAKLAKIMNTLDPKRAARLTELLAGVVRASSVTASNDAAETTNTKTKGGEKNDNKPESIISGGPDQFAQRAPGESKNPGQ